MAATDELKMPAARLSSPLAWLALALALPLAACQTGGLPNLPVSIDPSTASESNIESLSAVIAREPSNPEAYNVRGSAYGRAGRYDDAMADFDKAIELNPNFARAYFNRALVHRRNSDDKRALDDFNNAIRADPRYAPAYVGRGNMYRQNGQLDFALADYNGAIQLDRTDPQAFHNRGLVYQSQGNHQAAI